MIFFTRVTKDYLPLAERLAASCVKFDLRFVCRPIEGGGSTWRDIERNKPNWVMHELVHYREPVCWLDSDCTIERLPTLLLNTAHDFAAYNWNADSDGDSMAPAYSYNPSQLNVSGGVLMFGYTAPAMELVVRWNSQTNANRTALSSDQTLNEAFGTQPPVRPLWLPRSYNRMASHWPTVEPVIDHDYRAGHHGERNGYLDGTAAPTEPRSGIIAA